MDRAGGSRASFLGRMVTGNPHGAYPKAPVEVNGGNTLEGGRRAKREKRRSENVGRK